MDGRAVEVVNPGRRGGGAGPDFVDAVVLLDGVERRGDVELHVRASAFRGHGHATDPAYDQLALHVVYRADDGPETASVRRRPGAGGGVCAVAGAARRRAGELAGGAVDVAGAVPRRRRRGWATQRYAAALREAGQRRFRARSRGVWRER